MQKKIKNKNVVKPECHFEKKIKQRYIPLISRGNLDYSSASALP